MAKVEITASNELFMNPCPLCQHRHTYPLSVAAKCYYRCLQCAMVFLDPRFYLDAAAEKAIYDLHENHLDDSGYRAFLERTLVQVRQHIPSPASGLDFGCGPGPVLIAMAQEAGYQMTAYDKYYCDHPQVFTQCYDFITCTEVVEHLAQPFMELQRVWQCLKPGGVLVIQTQRVLNDQRFMCWRYKDDPTHIVFFAAESFAYLAHQWSATVEYPARDVVVLHKGSS